MLAGTLAGTTIVTSAPAGSETPGETTDASVTDSTTEVGNEGSYDTDLSADGQVVAMTITYDGDDEFFDEQRVYVYDVPTGTHELISVGEVTDVFGKTTTTPMDGSQPSISADGNRVAFVAEREGVTGIELRDRAAGETTTIVLPFRRAGQPAISDDGSHIAFIARTAVEGSQEGVYVRDAEAATTPILVSHMPGDPDAAPAGRVMAPAISGDGGRIVFISDADFEDDSGTVVAAGEYNVWSWERSTGEVTLVSRTLSGDKANSCPAVIDVNGVPRHGVDISADGRYASFTCESDDLVEDDGHVGADVFVADLDTGVIELVSVTSEGLPANGPSYASELSADGRYVVFDSLAKNLLDGPDDNSDSVPPFSQVYVRDRIGERTTRVSLDDNDGELPGFASHSLPSISSTGRYVSWTTLSFDCIGPDCDGQPTLVGQSYHRDRLPVLEVSPPTMDFGTVPAGTGSPPMTATVRNGGFGPLDVTGLSVGGANPGDFTISGSTCTEPLHFGDTCTFFVSFDGAPEGSYSAQANVQSTAPGPDGVIELAATSAARGGGTRPTCETDPSLCEPPEENCETDPSLCEPPEENCETDPSLCEPPEENCETDPSLCEPPEENCETDPSLCEPPEENCDTDPSLCEPPEKTCETDPNVCPPKTCETDASLCPPAKTCETDPSLCGPIVDPDVVERGPSIRISPSVVRLGRVTMATGEGWTPDSIVMVALDVPDRVGGTRDVVAVRTDEEGRFRKAIAIRHRIEEVGPRTAVALDQKGATATDDYLVALPSFGASTSFAVRYKDGSLVLVPLPLFGHTGTGPTNRVR